MCGMAGVRFGAQVAGNRHQSGPGQYSTVQQGSTVHGNVTTLTRYIKVVWDIKYI
jgi:hypothetical protein